MRQSKWSGNARLLDRVQLTVGSPKKGERNVSIMTNGSMQRDEMATMSVRSRHPFIVRGVFAGVFFFLFLILHIFVYVFFYAFLRLFLFQVLFFFLQLMMPARLGCALSICFSLFTDVSQLVYAFNFFKILSQLLASAFVAQLSEEIFK